MKFTFILIAILASSSLFAKIYKYRDSRGRIHYVDDISKIPGNKLTSARILNTKFLKTDYKVIDKYRRIILKKGVCYKNLKEQKEALLYWGNYMINAGFPEFKVDVERIKRIRLVNKNGKKLTKKQRRKKARLLSNFFKVFENSWPMVYEEIHFKRTGNKAIDDMRKNSKNIKTNESNLALRINLIEEWAKIIKENKNADSKLITERLNTISAMYDVPKPNIKELVKYVDSTIRIFEKEFRK